MEQPEIAILRNFTPGLSITLVADALAKHFEAAGYHVAQIDTKTRDFDVSACHKRHVLSLDDRALPDALTRSGYVFPRRIVSLWVRNWEELSPIQQVTYLACFLKPKVSGAPIVHVSHSLYTDRLVRDFGRKTFAPSVARTLEEQLRVNLFGISETFAARGVNDPDRLIVPYNRVNQSQKNIKLHVEVSRQYKTWAELHGYEPTIDFFYADAFRPERKDYDVGEDVYRYAPQLTDRDAFSAALPAYGLFLSTSLFESFGIYYLELLASGVVGVFLDRPWVRQLLPGYRFVAGKGDLASTLVWVREHYSEAQDYLSKEVIPFIRERYAFDRFCRDLLQEVVVGTHDQGG